MRRSALLLVAGLAAPLAASAQERPPRPGDGDEPPDACTLAATAVFDPCCPFEGGEAGDPTNCVYTAVTYAEMCGIRECTVALSAADSACAAEDLAESPQAQAYSLIRQAVNCAGLDDPCVDGVQATMTTCGLSADVLLEDTAQLQALAQASVCADQACLADMQRQEETCGASPDFGTQMTLGLFTSLLGTCGALATPGMTCTEQQLAQITAECGPPATPTCTPDCIGIVTQMVGLCPLTFTDPAMVTLASTCGANAAIAASAPCPDGFIDELLAQSQDCEAFTNAVTTALAAAPCADLGTNPELQQAMTACGMTVAGLPPCEPGTVDGLLGLSRDCPQFNLALAEADPCQELTTDAGLQAAMIQCGATLPAAGGDDEGGDGGVLAALAALNAVCPPEVTEESFHDLCW